MDCDPIALACAAAGIAAGRAIRQAVHDRSPAERAERVPSLLKPQVGELTRRVDLIADTIGVAHLERLGRAIGRRIEVILDPLSGATHRVGDGGGPEVVYAYMDAVDGTIKVGGLGNDLDAGRFRAANDGGWAAALAFTPPTAAPLASLTIGDFTTAALVEGNPTWFRTCPQEVVVLPGPDGRPRTYDAGAVRDWGAPFAAVPTFTTSSTDLSQCMVYLDSFQAFDRATRLAGDEELAVEIYRRLINRHDGGAFDVLRQYANLSALLRTMLGWRGEPTWIESQGGAFVVVNENLYNLIPAVPVILGAGGLAVDFDGRPLAARPLTEGRTSIVYAANAALCEHVLRRIGEARAAAGIELRKDRPDPSMP
jgi:hypothetical protein